jgi:hypothetical protein
MVPYIQPYIARAQPAGRRVAWCRKTVAADVEVSVNFFEVRPEVLIRQGPVISGESNTLSAIAMRLRTLGASAAATGFPDAAEALDHFSAVASARTERMKAAVDGIGDAMGVSGATYTRVDQAIADDIGELGDQLDGTRYRARDHRSRWRPRRAAGCRPLPARGRPSAPRSPEVRMSSPLPRWSRPLGGGAFRRGPLARHGRP